MESEICLEMNYIAAKIRRQILELDYHTGGGHIGGAFGATDILTTLFFGIMDTSPERSIEEDQTRDRFVLSKGHISDAYYSVLAEAGYFPKEELSSYIGKKSRLSGHPTNKVPGVEINTGALGHGLPAACGIAKSQKMNGIAAHTYVLTGDGELAEGSNWEAAMFAANYHLDNLTLIIDRNGLQIGGRTENVMALEPLADKWRAFGWNVVEVDGHDISALMDVLSKENTDKPRCVIAHTYKGHGVSFMEDNYKWHHGTPNDEQYIQAASELDQKIVETAAQIGKTPELMPLKMKEPKKSGPKYIAARAAVTAMLTERAKTDNRIVAVTSDARGSASLEGFVDEHPDKFIEVGIAEQNEIGVAAGLWLGGKIPFVCAPASFLSGRAYEQVKTDLAYSHIGVKLLAVSGGASYTELGQTHHSLQDIATMRALPGMEVVIPADAASARKLAEQSIERKAPMYMRVGRAATADVYTDDKLENLVFGKASMLRDGKDGCIISCGVMTLNALKAAEQLEKDGIDVCVIDIHTLKPLDTEAIIAAADRFGKLMTVEEHVIAGGLGAAVLETLSEHPIPIKMLSVPDVNAICGTANEIYAEYGIDQDGIIREVKKWL